MRWHGSFAKQPSLSGAVVLVNLSGRGDKDVAQMMDIIA
jgi:tryptophan synthase beta subunit